MTENSVTDNAAEARKLNIARWTATVFGLLGFVLSVSIPLLPVKVSTATLDWPQQGRLNNVTAPLISQTPMNMTVIVPCAVVNSAPADGAVILGTAPPEGKEAALQSLFVRVTKERLDITDRNVVIASVPRTKVASPDCRRIVITSSDKGTFATFEGLHGDGAEKSADLRSGFPDPNLRPQIVGVFTQLSGPAPQGLSLTAHIDTRFSSSPTLLKLAAMVGAVISTIVAVLALWRIDQTDGHRMRRLIPTRWRRFDLTDTVIMSALVLWYVIGAGSSDDGYQMGMARTAEHAGYMANYFRWFGSPEDPFGWYYNLLAIMTKFSDISLWIRLPDLIASLVCWLLISREVLPRLGPAVARSKPAAWAAGFVLLASWFPFNNGLRPEGQIAVGSLITWVLIERAITSRRLTPAALATITAAFTLGIQPTGLIAVAALLAGGRPILRIIVTKHRQVGTWPLVAPMLAAGTVILPVVFSDQTLATVFEATRIRTAIGPSQAWYTDNLRYYYMFLPTVDGSVSRRFGFLLIAACLFIAMFILLRRKRVPGVARGPAWRVLGVVFGTIFFLMFAPTKWVHHFGLFAALGAAVAALATVLVSPQVLRWSRNRMAVVATVLFVLALSWASAAGWWYVSSFGIPFNSSMPKIAGISVSTIFFALFALAVGYAAWLHFSPRHADNRITKSITSAPVAWAAGFMVLTSICQLAIGVARQYPSYSNGWANIRELAGGCGLADDVLVEPDANAGFLPAIGGQETGALGPLGGSAPSGFTADGVPDKIVAESIRMNDSRPGTDYDWDSKDRNTTPGVNGSTVRLPYGLDPARVPIVGSYRVGPQQQAKVTSDWYRLPARDAAHPLIVVTAAGTIAAKNVKGELSGQTLQLEYGTAGPDGAFSPLGRLTPYDLGPAPSWRNLRFARSDIPEAATAVRIVAIDGSLTPGDWLAFAPPRVPELKSLQEYVGSTRPVLLDWTVGLVFPCQHPMLHQYGITEVPEFRITPDYDQKRKDTDTWQDGENGGLLGITDLLLRAHVMPTYLSKDWGRDWGSLRKLDTIVDAQPAQIEYGSQVHSGLWKPNQIRIKP
ncbi:arabinosyltransferase B [Mycobacteroides abscessus subsp. massiliense]|uniref:arabinosyltransferase domain-containing protein n=1 Tax=Mycobacteroides abscessus TaxID=36809 RepID=UPI0009A617CA|nr:arabinosyltransferase domain-containing protein [Mycobacteroides abscessus]SKH71679.1 arabinosyltransferase B [Mycobacteroides abscessus subsp. massiliense]SKH84122.1 arabinosyltransferase B [Mycobacteroides abscessus subsp. massiliense]SKI10652.1 arabinosyltransferase B [Mycobacteroides abscessus subsp. massiliense]SKK27977.1 arabinosyltransferase B [Mycobacteroides abscessus subsp. massiliense]SKZ30869.1 arabinosyltransferase B [Mycobacteroides abscessus subsp. massiliense]